MQRLGRSLVQSLSICGNVFRPVCSIEEAIASTSSCQAELEYPTARISVRSKTYTSNVMDENRSRRIREHFAYNKAKKAWRADVHERLRKWRGEQRASEISSTATMQHGPQAGLGLRQKEEEQASVARSHVVQLEEEVRRAQLDHDVVRVLRGLGSVRCCGGGDGGKGCLPSAHPLPHSSSHHVIVCATPLSRLCYGFRELIGLRQERLSRQP